MSRERKDPEIRKQEIIKTSEKLFIEKGYENTSILDILQEANISSGGFYHHFKSKKEVLNAIHNRQVEDYEQKIKKLVNDIRFNPIQKLFITINSDFPEDYGEPNMLIFNLYSYQGDDTFSIVYELFIKMSKRLAKVIVKIYEEGLESGYFKKIKYPIKSIEIIILMYFEFKSLSSSKEDIIKYYDIVDRIVENRLGLEEGTFKRNFN